MGLRDSVAETYRPEMTVPFTLYEYQQRVMKVRKEMEKTGIDLLYCTAPVSLFYLTGYQVEWYQGEEPTDWLPVGGIAIHRNSEKILFFDRSGHEPLTHSHILGDHIEIRVHSYKIQEETGLNELEFVIKCIRDEGWMKGTVGLEKMSHRPNPLVSKMVQDAFESEGCTVINASDIVRTIRSVKSPQEIAYHRTAGKICDIGIRAAQEHLKPGVTEMDIRAEVLYALTKAGGEYTGIPIPVLTGARTTTGHALTSRKVIMPGDIVMIDICGVYNRYHTNTSRPFSVGEPHPDVKKQLEKSSGAVKLLGEILKPGLTAKEVSSTLREYYKKEGIWDDRRWCGGYEIGPAFAPSWVGSWVYNISEKDEDERVFVPGNVMNHESQIYLPRGAGLSFLIDTIAFEEDDASFLTDIPPELIIVE